MKRLIFAMALSVAATPALAQGETISFERIQQVAKDAEQICPTTADAPSEMMATMLMNFADIKGYGRIEKSLLVHLCTMYTQGQIAAYNKVKGG